jgi:putative membrane protein
MHRRVVLTGFTALAVGPALAQTQQPSPIPATPRPAQDTPPSAAGGVYQGGAGQSGAAMGQGAMGQGAMGQAEMEHVQRTLAAGMVALQTSEIALQKAQNPNVKQFAQFERDEQTTLAEVLRSWQEPAATASTGASPASATSTPAIPADKANMMQALQQARPGAEFDRMYIQGQIQGHQELLQIQERYLQGSRNREHGNVAKLARGHIKEHLAMLQDLQKEIRG